ncbi:23S rRNA (adenine2030-N6)-methyltransferase [Fulvimarina manganoxydans]|uniref:Ribosomal RNA large subunit methyltransferase J n=1 Tax=Fulvimarina manganoxydans TaxID=937218 RepID=A0A1W1YL13_9HYPH|nr:23S rRNA (adenine(2030)-N(6))-methyltransferase RlmJ [Fulvimarina manganoxydans]SMC36829.1 23S rRNA (adenine2030-N6)-methyltransferase [Fulvimarina manganoxydans]
MNYRHAYHAGNFADVVKHALLTRLIAYLKRKEKAFRVYDTHAGRGLYDLSSESALKTREAEDGVTRFLSEPALAEHPLLADYRAALGTDIDDGLYPGSPLIARRCLRPQDRLSAYELHPEDADALKALFAGDVQAKAIALDGWLALGAHLPPKEKRGLVLIDPPFEKTSEIDDIVEGVGKAYKRWPGGTFAVWYPIKRETSVRALRDGLAAIGDPETLAAELIVEALRPGDERFVGTGLAVINPPFVFAEEAQTIFDALLPVLARDPSATARVFRLKSKG